MSNQITPNPSVPSQIVQGLKFPNFITSLGIIPTSYKDSMSYYECLAWLCKYLEETVIPTLNQNGMAVEELQGLYIQLNEYVTNYFDNLDVQEEINNKLDEMAEDGTLENLISQILELNPTFAYDNITEMLADDRLVDGNVVFTKNGYHEDSANMMFKIVDDTEGIYIVDNEVIFSLSDNLKAVKIANGYNYVKPLPVDYTQNDYSIIFGYNADFKVDTYLNHNGKEFYMLDHNIAGFTRNVADPTCLFKNNKLYVCYDSLVSADLPQDIPAGVWYGSNRLFIQSSEDCKNFTAPVKITPPSNSMWLMYAPEFFEYNDTVYLLFTGTTTYQTDSNNRHFKSKTYIMHALNDDLTEWSDASEIVLSDGLEFGIDPAIIQKGSEFYFFIKDNENTNYTVKEYYGTTLTSMTYIKDLTSEKEGPEVFEMNGTYYLYCDRNATGNYSHQYVATSTDLLNWSSFTRVNNYFYNIIACKHFGYILVNTPETHKFFDNYIKNYPLAEEKAKVYEMSKATYPINKIVELENSYDMLYVEKNTIYKAYNHSCTINAMNIDALNEGDMVGFYLGSENASYSITITSSSNFFVPNDSKPFILSVDNKNNNDVIWCIKISNFLLPCQNATYLKSIREKAYNRKWFWNSTTNISSGVDYNITFNNILTPLLYGHNTYKLFIEIGDANINQGCEVFMYIRRPSSDACYVVIATSGKLVFGTDIQSITGTYDMNTKALTLTVNTNTTGRVAASIELIGCCQASSVNY